MPKDEGKGLLEKAKDDIIDGYSKIKRSLSEGSSAFLNNTYILLKYTLLTIVLSVSYVFIQGIPYISYAYLLPATVLILHFHYEFLIIPVKDLKRFSFNTLSLTFLLLISYVTITFNPQSHSQDQFPTVHLISTFISLFSFALFLFQPVYMVKAGATPLKALKNAFGFISNNALKTMTYIIILFFALSILSSIPSLTPLSFLSPVVFIYLSYGVFIFIHSFWEVCRKK
ncbi:MAG: hypothetical protein ACP5H8_00680 [Candidatus Micrarchaeia archaeon]